MRLTLENDDGTPVAVWFIPRDWACRLVVAAINRLPFTYYDRDEWRALVADGAADIRRKP